MDPLMTTTYNRITEMEAILDKATALMDDLEKAMEEYEAYQSEISRLEAYYTGRQWKEDLAADEEGRLPADLKRGVLSEDAVFNMLERNKELLRRIRSV